MRLLDLISDPQTNTLSHTKLGACVGLASGTAAFFIEVVRHQLTAELLLAYGALMSGHYILKRFVDSRGSTVDLEPKE